MSDNVLFSPFTRKNLTLPNRIVMAPMPHAMAPEGIPGQPNVDYYRRRAGGARNAFPFTAQFGNATAHFRPYQHLGNIF